MVKSNAPEEMGDFFNNRDITKLKFIYKGKEYFPLPCTGVERISVITRIIRRIFKSINFKIGDTILFNKAKRVALYGGDGEHHKKLMDINYDDVIVMRYPFITTGFIINLTTGKLAYDNFGYRYLEFREE